MSKQFIRFLRGGIEGQRMIDACRASGSKLTISHQRYYNPQYAQARELIAQGAIGEVRFVEAMGMAPSIHTDLNFFSYN